MSDSPPQTKTVRYIATAWTPDTPLPDGAKIIHFVRHGEGEHNRAFKATRSLEEYKNEAWFDSRLTEVGVSTAKELQSQVRDIPLHAVYVSTLSRAIQTALHAFEKHDVPFISTELIRERIGTHPCDRRRSRKELEADFGHKVAFHLIEDGDDPLWSPDREPWAHLVQRGNNFLDFVWGCEHKAVACVAHCDFFMGLFEKGDWDVMDPLSSKSFANCELRSVILTKPPPLPPSDA